MHSSNAYALLAVLASTASAQNAATATVLLPDWCITQAAPAVTVVGKQNGLTSYTYACSADAVSRASASQATLIASRDDRYESRASERSVRSESRASSRSAWSATRSSNPTNTDVPCVPNPYTPYDDCEWQDGVPSDKRSKYADVPCIPNPFTPYDDCDWQNDDPYEKRSKYANVPCIPNPFTPYDDCDWQNDDPYEKRSKLAKKDDEDGKCHGWFHYDGCVPWKVIQGENVWAVQLNVPGEIRVDQHCSFGPGGVASGVATCTADGRVDYSVWGKGSGPQTRTFQPGEVDKYFFRNTIVAPAVATAAGNGSGAAGSSVARANVGTLTGANASPTYTPVQAARQEASSTGQAAHMALPTGLMAMAAGAGGIFMAAVAL